MPKNISNITKFLTGTISGPSPQDISLDTAQHSTNIDPVARDGILSSVNTDKYLRSGGFTDFSYSSGIPTEPSDELSVIASAMSLISDGTVHNLFYFDPNDSKIKIIKDLYLADTSNYGASNEVTTLSSSSELNSSGVIAMEQNNKEVHIGMDDGDSLWAGNIGTPQFDTYQTSDGGIKNDANTYTPILAKAELMNPGLFPEFDSVVFGTVDSVDYMYGLKTDDSYIYTFKVSDSSFVGKSDVRFGKVTAIGASKYSDGVWVFDSAAGSGGTLYLYDGFGKAFSFTCPVKHTSKNNTDVITGTNWTYGKPTHIVETDHLLWFMSGKGSSYNKKGIDAGTGFRHMKNWYMGLDCAVRPESSGDLYLSSKKFKVLTNYDYGLNFIDNLDDTNGIATAETSYNVSMSDAYITFNEPSSMEDSARYPDSGTVSFVTHSGARCQLKYGWIDRASNTIGDLSGWTTYNDADEQMADSDNTKFYFGKIYGISKGEPLACDGTNNFDLDTNNNVQHGACVGSVTPGMFQNTNCDGMLAPITEVDSDARVKISYVHEESSVLTKGVIDANDNAQNSEFNRGAHVVSDEDKQLIFLAMPSTASGSGATARIAINRVNDWGNITRFTLGGQNLFGWADYNQDSSVDHDVGAALTDYDTTTIGGTTVHSSTKILATALASGSSEGEDQVYYHEHSGAEDASGEAGAVYGQGLDTENRLWFVLAGASCFIFRYSEDGSSIEVLDMIRNGTSAGATIDKGFYCIDVDSKNQMFVLGSYERVCQFKYSITNDSITITKAGDDYDSGDSGEFQGRYITAISYYNRKTGGSNSKGNPYLGNIIAYSGNYKLDGNKNMTLGNVDTSITTIDPSLHMWWYSQDGFVRKVDHELTAFNWDATKMYGTAPIADNGRYAPRNLFVTRSGGKKYVMFKEDSIFRILRFTNKKFFVESDYYDGYNNNNDDYPIQGPKDSEKPLLDSGYMVVDKLNSEVTDNAKDKRLIVYCNHGYNGIDAYKLNFEKKYGGGKWHIDYIGNFRNTDHHSLEDSDGDGSSDDSDGCYGQMALMRFRQTEIAETAANKAFLVNCAVDSSSSNGSQVVTYRYIRNSKSIQQPKQGLIPLGSSDSVGMYIGFNNSVGGSTTGIQDGSSNDVRWYQGDNDLRYWKSIYRDNCLSDNKSAWEMVGNSGAIAFNDGNDANADYGTDYAGTNAVTNNVNNATGYVVSCDSGATKMVTAIDVRVGRWYSIRAKFMVGEATSGIKVRTIFKDGTTESGSGKSPYIELDSEWKVVKGVYFSKFTAPGYIGFEVADTSTKKILVKDIEILGDTVNPYHGLAILSHASRMGGELDNYPYYIFDDAKSDGYNNGTVINGGENNSQWKWKVGTNITMKHNNFVTTTGSKHHYEGYYTLHKEAGTVLSTEDSIYIDDVLLVKDQFYTLTIEIGNSASNTSTNTFCFFMNDNDGTASDDKFSNNGSGHTIPSNPTWNLFKYTFCATNSTAHGRVGLKLYVVTEPDNGHIMFRNFSVTPGVVTNAEMNQNSNNSVGAVAIDDSDSLISPTVQQNFKLLGYETSEYLEQGKIGPFVHSISTNPLNEFKNLIPISRTSTHSANFTRGTNWTRTNESTITFPNIGAGEIGFAKFNNAGSGESLYYNSGTANDILEGEIYYVYLDVLHLSTNDVLNVSVNGGEIGVPDQIAHVGCNQVVECVAGRNNVNNRILNDEIVRITTGTASLSASITNIRVIRKPSVVITHGRFANGSLTRGDLLGEQDDWIAENTKTSIITNGLHGIRNSIKRKSQYALSDGALTFPSANSRVIDEWPMLQPDSMGEVIPIAETAEIINMTEARATVSPGTDKDYNVEIFEGSVQNLNNGSWAKKQMRTTIDLRDDGLWDGERDLILDSGANNPNKWSFTAGDWSFGDNGSGRTLMIHTNTATTAITQTSTYSAGKPIEGETYLVTLDIYINIGSGSERQGVSVSVAGGTAVDFIPKANNTKVVMHGLCKAGSTVDDVIKLTPINDALFHIEHISMQRVGEWTASGIGEDAVVATGRIGAFLDVESSEYSSGYGKLVEGTKYFYKFSFTYDGYQEGPLSSSTHVHIIEEDKSKLELTIGLRNLDLINKRISHFNVYRSDSLTDVNAEEAIGDYRLVKTVSLDGKWIEQDNTTENPSWGNTRERVIRDVGKSFASYDNRTGIPEAVDSQSVKYKYSTQLFNTHFIAKVKTPFISDGDNYILRSKSGRFNTFNPVGTNEFLKMPKNITGIQAHADRLYVFSDNSTYLVDPFSMRIEKEFTGYGCLGPTAVYSCNDGMVFCDNNNIYYVSPNGGTPVAIGDAIKKGETDNNDTWEDKKTDYTPVVTYESKFRSFVIFFKNNQNKYRGWSYNIQNKRWDLWVIQQSQTAHTQKPLSVVNGKDGEILTCLSDDASSYDNSKLIGFLQGSDKRAWTWQSKELNMGKPLTDKKFYKVKLDGINVDSTISASMVSTKTNKGTATTTIKSSANETAEWIISGNVKARWIEISLSSNLADEDQEEVDGIGVIFRDQRIK